MFFGNMIWLDLGKIVNDGRLSEIARVRLPLTVSELKWFVNMLSINVSIPLLILVRNNIVVRKFDMSN